jgi:hypothetical protein
MMRLPPKRKPRGSGLLRVPEKIWNRHRKFVRSHTCCVAGCEQGPIEFAHVRTAANSGTSAKPHDWAAVSLCADHHAEQHRGNRTFEKKYGLDLMAIARAFAKASPDTAMKEAMRSMDHSEHADREAVGQ